MKYSLIICSLLCIVSPCGGQSLTDTVYLWDEGAPGFPDRKDIPERAQDWWVRDIHHPNITVFEPEKPSGLGAVIFPGGGHSSLVYNSEGKRAARHLNEMGITAFVIKYRLFREENLGYTVGHAKQDAFRAMRMTRNIAAKYGVDPDRIGVLAFSAGGELASLLSFSSDTLDTRNSIDTLPHRPRFLIQVYPGPLFIPQDKIPTDAPPAFLVASNNDECCAETNIQLLQLYRNARIPIEFHLFSHGGHAFNMGDKWPHLKTIHEWPQRLLQQWFTDWNYFKKDD